ncbi:desampylase [Natrinema salifodinae]|uniref:Proteasome lid subunit RPN8/RPN11, contains Jab1/MPN metalloenzyme (JAMM) motif n=1 Tax=Natrinema salifodinae TaxID=1202768 RepID=A0A1I0PPL2_9EURY|nr:desampylase [Natrinema salifodinae]SEW15758.1 Proteasome lid subunit RPN8/RPN11, contains Jab1/MPN metalloenzyme (JAMM) motif [Natrinema salifodinae]
MSEFDSESDATDRAPDGESAPELVVPDSVREAVLERAREGRPREICGVFGGEFAPDGRSRVRSQYPAENVAETPRTRYEIDPEEQLAIFDRLADRGEEIVGFYHSHPRGPARPSETDAAQAAWPDRSYLIVSVEPFAVGSWRWRTESDDGDGGDADDEREAPGGRFERERVVVD